MIDRRPSRLQQRAVASAVSLVLLTQLLSPQALAGDLTLDAGVVVKFGPNAQLVVRDRLVTGAGVVLTSQKDDSAGGQAASAPQTAAAGDWRGLRLEKSASAYGALTLSDMSVRYAGADDGFGAAAALTVRGWSPKLDYLQLSDNALGLSLLEGASPAISGASFLRNGTGIDADGNSTAVISGSQFSGNASFAVNNRTPATIIQAGGNWWGHATGPKDAVNNPQGQGDAVSAGVNASAFLSAEPLINPSVRMSAPASYIEQHAVQLDLACVNAIEYRIAENGGFAGTSFQPLANGRTQVSFTTSGGDGRKTIDVQYRNAAGAIASVTVPGGVLVDTAAPVVRLVNPAPGVVIGQATTLQATASDASGIAKVQFYIDGASVASLASEPYSYAWNVTGVADGEHVIKVAATDGAGRVSEQSATITVAHSSTAPDIEGPKLTNIIANGSALADGAVFSRNASLALSASDSSGVVRVELLLDGSVIATASGSSSYAVTFDLTGVANGAHTLGLRALDSVGNASTANYAVTVAHAAPDAPVLSQPANGTTVRTAELPVSGKAIAGSKVQLFVNGVAAGGLLTADGSGLFSGSVTLAPGANKIAATAADQYGTSAMSAMVTVTLDQTVPSSPGALTGQAQEAGKVHLAWTRSTDPNATGYNVYRAPVAFATIAEAVKLNAAPLSGATYDDMPPQDGAWTYRIVAVNAAGTPSAPGNAVQVQSDSKAPKALAIVYVSTGKTDPATGRLGQGRVNLTLTLSEALQTAPYLSIVPQGGAPIPVDLVKSGDTVYTGSFLIDAGTPSGTANALFSARDAVGNRGTDIDAGGTLTIDTAGPVLSSIALNPGAPIKNDSAQPASVNATFTFSKAPAGAPLVKYLLSGPVRQPVAVNNVVQVNPTTYSASVSLPADAGLGSPESLSFSFQAQDDLGNVSTKVAAFNRFQVYQGNLPPLNVPFGFTAQAQPGGKVLLGWQTVDEAISYQLYRQAPGKGSLEALVRTGGTSYIDQTSQDGLYKYAIATVRQSNGQESVSGQSAPVDVTAIASGPGAPQNLALQLTGQGIYASWQPPLSSTVAYYKLYRAGGTAITGIDGLTPLKTKIGSTQTYDANPSPTQGAYVVTAVDAAGNESAISNSAYLNASLLPVRQLTVEQIGNSLPAVHWTAPNGNVSGYLVYVGPDNSKIKLTPSPISATSLTDTGYTSGERRYAVASVDANGVELARTIVLPSVATQVAAGLPLKRGMMNRLQVQVANTSAGTLSQVRAVVRIPIDKDATQFKDHKSEPFALGPNETRLVPVVVGGYADLPSRAQSQVGVEIVPDEDGLVKIARDQALDVTDGALVVGMATDEFTRGGTGKLKLTIENTGDIDIELLTATNNGSGDSTELRFKILDADGNVLATQPYKQALGASVVTLTNGQTVARIPAGANYVSDVFELNVPEASPNSVRVRLDVDKLRYHTGQPDEVQIAGRGSERTVSLIDTAYMGEVTDVSPLSSFGDQDVVITGRALDRASRAPLPNTRLKLVLNQQGFERSFMVLTDGSGSFVYPFKPTVTDSGLYKVSAVHPSITDRPEQKAFTINRVTVGPSPYKLDVPKNASFSIPFTAKAGPGTSATNLRLVLNPASQPTGQVPTGITVQPAAPVSLAERQTLNVPLLFSAGNEAQPSGSLILDVVSDQHPAPIGQVSVNYQLSEAKPYLVPTPSYVETGIAQGGSQVETLSLKNSGLQDALNLKYTLTRADGSPAPAWASIVSQAAGDLAVGATRTLDLSFMPPSSVSAGVYEFKLNVTGDNIPPGVVNVYVNLSQSGQGNVLFKASDIYTATIGKDGKLIPGLAGARITLQNEDVPAISLELSTDNLGEALFKDVPAGSYKFRAKASNHQEIGGRMLIKPGMTINQPVFLDYNLVTVEWSVREVTIQDRYEITLNATFETDVPAAVVVMQPSSINLPNMNPGDVYYGELALTNYGLVRADKVAQQLPKSDGFFRYEFLVDVPATLDPKQRLTVPYRVVALQPLDGATSGQASGGGCFNYSNTTSVTCQYTCSNGNTTVCGASASFFAVSNSTCTGGGGGGGGGGGSGGGWGGGWGGASSPGQALPNKGQKCVFVPEGGNGAPQACH
jgi:fibronectin type 3 domain-containing protein